MTKWVENKDVVFTCQRDINVQELTQESLKKLLHYDAETGVFTWEINPCKNIKHGDTAGTINTRGYLIITINKKQYGAHRLAWLYIHGHWPINLIDHINSVKIDNRLVNLREATLSENMQNQKSAQRNNLSSGLIGVTFNKRCGKFISRIMLNNKRKNLGYFNTAEEAHRVYIEEKRKLHKFNTL